eukprot:GEZU01002032.1.p1 GENE.GEZU01002032.1~~GEZU01002032.1.p1  ORF type:complete len:132 (+),score=12.81 GEZU01002032.1:47-442(+)
MYYNACRKEEKKLRVAMIDHKKRAERKALFMAKLRGDPAQQLKIVGRKCKLLKDSVQREQVEDERSLTQWQGDANVLIDRCSNLHTNQNKPLVTNHFNSILLYTLLSCLILEKIPMLMHHLLRIFNPLRST